MSRSLGRRTDDGGGERNRFFEGLARVLMGSDRPLIVLAALQRCGCGALDSLPYLLGFEEADRLSVAGTCRPVPGDPADARAALLHDIGRGDPSTDASWDPLKGAKRSLLRTRQTGSWSQTCWLPCTGKRRATPFRPGTARGSASPGSGSQSQGVRPSPAPPAYADAGCAGLRRSLRREVTFGPRKCLVKRF